MTRDIKTVSCVSEYLNILSNLNITRKFVFRGEKEKYPKFCMPSIFRYTEYFDDKQFESKVIDKYSLRYIDKDVSYLYKAMDLQHGGFPSRLLDVSFNSLVALHFAVTPHFKYNVSSSDNLDGVVYVVNCEKLSSPNTMIASKIFEYAILQKGSIVDSYTHFILDHMAINERIKVQNGGFILFPGREFRDIEYLIEEEIRILGKNKERIRNELSNLFGIDNGYVYPENDHQVERYIRDTKYYRSIDFVDKFANYYNILRDFLERYKMGLVELRDELFNCDVNKIEFISQLKSVNKSDPENYSEVQKQYDIYLNGRRNTKSNQTKFINEYTSLCVQKSKNIIDKSLQIILDFVLDFNISIKELKQMDMENNDKITDLVDNLEEEILKLIDNDLKRYLSKFDQDYSLETREIILDMISNLRKVEEI